MKQELEAELKRKYPRVFVDLQNPEITRHNSCLSFGLEIGDGWYSIIDECAAGLEKEIENWLRENEKDFPFEVPKIVQVKEKFGIIRIYTNILTEKMDEIIRQAEVKSSYTCEECGKPGEMRGKGWLYIACNECYEKRKK